MAEPTRLHSLGLHIGLRVVSVLVGAFGATIVTQVLIARQGDAVALAAVGMLIVIMGVLAGVVWRTRPVLADGAHLLIGPAKNRRRVAFSDVVSVGRPWWVLTDRVASPLELQIRGGDTVLFFPEWGAAEFIAARRDG